MRVEEKDGAKRASLECSETSDKNNFYRLQ